MLHNASHICYPQQIKQGWVTLDIRRFSVTLCLVTVLVVCGSCTSCFTRHICMGILYIYICYQRTCKAILSMLCVWVQFQTELPPCIWVPFFTSPCSDQFKNLFMISSSIHLLWPYFMSTFLCLFSPMK
jgi:hypothetical protein